MPRIRKTAAIVRLSMALVPCAVAGAVGAIAWSGPASASVTWSSVGTVQFTDTKTGTIAACSSSSASMVPTSTGTNPAGHITSISFTGCTGPLGTVFTLTAAGLSWPVSAQPAVRTVGQTSGGHGVSVRVTGLACSADVDGTGGGTDTGVVHFMFRHLSGGLGVVVTDGNLHFYSVSGCSGLAGNGDPVSFSVSYHLS
jgi:hypothetical protein